MQQFVRHAYALKGVAKGGGDGAPGFCWHKAVAGPIDERRAAPRLEVAEAVTNGGGCDAEFACGSRERAGAENRLQRAQTGHRWCVAHRFALFYLR